MRIILALFLFLVYFEGINQEYQKINEFNTQNGLSNNNIRSFTKDNNGFYWLLTTTGLVRFDGKKFETINTIYGTNEPVPFIKFSKSSIKKIPFYYCNDSLTLYIDSNSQVRKFDKSKQFELGGLVVGDELILPYNFEHLKNEASKKMATFLETGAKDKKIYFIFQDTDSTFYTIIDKFHFYVKENRITNLTIPNDFEPISQININKFYVLIGNNGKYIIYNDGEIIYRGYLELFDNYNYLIKYIGFIHTAISRQNKYIKLSNKIYELILDNNNIKVKSVFTKNEGFDCFFLDNASGNLLINNFNNGFTQYATSDFKKVKADFFHTQENAIYSQVYTSSKKFIVTQNIIYKTRKYEKVKRGYEFAGPIIVLSKNKILSAYINNLFLFNEKLDIEKKWDLKNFGAKQLIATDSVVYLFNGTISKFYPKKRLFIEGKPRQDKIIAACSANEKDLFYLATEKNIQYFNVHTNKSTVILDKSIENIRNLFYDEFSKCLFISTQGSGIYIFNKATKVLTRLPLDKDKNLLYNHYVLADKDGDYWLPTNKGLYFLFKENLKKYLDNEEKLDYKKFGKEYGILNEEFNGGFSGAGILFNDSISLASMGGLVQFNPSIKYKKIDETGKLIVDYIMVNDSVVNLENKLELVPNFKLLSIKVSFPFIEKRNGYLEYRLKGSFDTNWLNVHENGIITLRNLNQGNYAIEIKVNDNVKILKQFQITVLPYWYNSWWAKIVWLILFLSSVYIIFMWRWQTVKNKELALQERSRKKMYTIIAHDLKSPIDNFTHLSDNIRFLIEQKDFETIATIGNEMDEKGRNLNLLLSNVLNWSTMQQNPTLSSKNKILIQEIFDEILPVYKDIATHKKIKVSFNNEVKDVLECNRILLSVIIRNIVDNAIKNSPFDSTVSIECNLNNKKLYITAKNKILDPSIEKATYINNVLAGNIKAIPHNEYLGLGIATIAESLTHLKGTGRVIIDDKVFIFYIDIPI